ncbi:unknown [Acidaminococcus intestini CAG:325]|nr:unknown [Acidaminococcus intestini CAG:325]
MGNAIVICQFYDLWVNKDKFDLVRFCPIKKTGNDGIDANGFTRPGRTGNQQMRHLAEIGHNNTAGDILAETDAKFSFGVTDFITVHDGTECHSLTVAARYLNPNGSLAWDWLNTDARHGKLQGNIFS